MEKEVVERWERKAEEYLRKMGYANIVGSERPALRKGYLQGRRDESKERQEEIERLKARIAFLWDLHYGDKEAK